MKLTFYIYDYSTGSYLDYDLTGRAQWSGFNLIYDAANNPAIGAEYLGFAWGGNFNPSLDDSRVVWSDGKKEKMYLISSFPNASRVWEFQEYREIPFWAHYAEDSYAVTALTKNTPTGNGNKTEFVCKYIHTYQVSSSEISFSITSGGAGADFSLKNTPKQWQLVCTFSGAYY